jgi:hypothetical protein
MTPLLEQEPDPPSKANQHYFKSKRGQAP